MVTVMPIIFKRTKILATLGPITSTPEMIKDLITAGTNGFRLNFSHGDYTERDDQIRWIREASMENGNPVAILQYLQVPIIRLGMLHEDIHVTQGEECVMATSSLFSTILPKR